VCWHLRDLAGIVLGIENALEAVPLCRRRSSQDKARLEDLRRSGYSGEAGEPRAYSVTPMPLPQPPASSRPRLGPDTG